MTRLYSSTQLSPYYFGKFFKKFAESADRMWEISLAPSVMTSMMTVIASDIKCLDGRSDGLWGNKDVKPSDLSATITVANKVLYPDIDTC